MATTCDCCMCIHEVKQAYTVKQTLGFANSKACNLSVKAACKTRFIAACTAPVYCVYCKKVYCLILVKYCLILVSLTIQHDET